MPIDLISNITPKNAGIFALLKDKDLQGGFRVVADVTARDAIPLVDADTPVPVRVVGMWVYTIATSEVWQLGVGLGNGDWSLVDLGGIPDTTGNEGKALFVGAGDVSLWRNILAGDITPVFDLTAFSITSASTVERGDTSALPGFTSQANRKPTTATLTDTDATPSQDLVSLFSAAEPSLATFASTGTFQKSATGSSNPNVVFTCAASDGVDNDQLTRTITWMRRYYFGGDVDPGAGNYTDVFLKALGSNPLTASKAKTLTASAPGVSDRVFFAYLAAHGAVTKIVDNDTGFDVTGAFTEVESATSVTTENVSAIAENYRVYMSNNAGLGTLNLTVT